MKGFAARLIIERRSRVLIDEALKGNRIIGLVTLKPEGVPNERGWLDIFPIGTVCVIDDFTRLPDGRLFVVLRSVMKFRVQQENSDRVYRSANIQPLPEDVAPADLEGEPRSAGIADVDALPVVDVDHRRAVAVDESPVHRAVVDGCPLALIETQDQMRARNPRIGNPDISA